MEEDKDVFCNKEMDEKIRDHLMIDLNFSEWQADYAMSTFRHKWKDQLLWKHRDDLRQRKIPKELKTDEEKIKWCEDHGGHLWEYGFMMSTCTTCDIDDGTL